MLIFYPTGSRQALGEDVGPEQFVFLPRELEDEFLKVCVDDNSAVTVGM